MFETVIFGLGLAIGALIGVFGVLIAIVKPLTAVADNLGRLVHKLQNPEEPPHDAH